MKRLVIGATGLLSAAGIVVLVGYLLVFSASADRAARAVPAGAAVYLNFYLQPSTGQRMNLYGLIGRLPGFGDPATLEQKIHDVAQRLIGEAEIDYEADIRPWLGNQLALAITPGDTLADDPHLLLLAAVRDAAAEESVDRVMSRGGATFSAEVHRGITVKIGDEVSYALLDDLLVIGDSAGQVRAAIDADADAAPSLADSSGFGMALRRVPADHVGSIYVDLRALASAGGIEQLGGYSTAAMALVAEDAGLHLVGDAPFDDAEAVDAAREAFALGSEPSSLADWMPADTTAEVVLFGLRQTIVALEEQVAESPALEEAAAALNQLRALAAIGLGINLDRDVLTLLDREVSVAIGDGAGGQPAMQLLLRPSDPAAASESLGRMRDALAQRGSRVATQPAGQIEITVVDVPEIGQIAYALTDGVVILALDPDDVAAILAVRAGGQTLSATRGYRDAFGLAGTRGGNEAWVDVAGAIEAAGEMLEIDDQTRGILLRIGAFAVTAPTHDNRLEIHAVLTVR